MVLHYTSSINAISANEENPSEIPTGFKLRKKTVRAFFVAVYRSGNTVGNSDKATLWHTRGTV